MGHAFEAVVTDSAAKPYTIQSCPNGIVIVVAKGFWDMHTVQRYWIEITPYLKAARTRFGRVKALIDKRGSPPQSQSVMECLTIGSQRNYGADDRVAMVLDTSLQKMQARRVFPADRMKAFLSYDAAMTWLLAF